jgi:hypothetical protein
LLVSISLNYIQSGNEVIIPVDIKGFVFFETHMDLTIATKQNFLWNTQLEQVEELYVTFFNCESDACRMLCCIDALIKGMGIEQRADQFSPSCCGLCR